VGSAVSDRALVLTEVIAVSQNKDEIRDWTGLPWDRVDSTLEDLTRRDIVASGGDHYYARQRGCANCSRPGFEMEGETVFIDPESLRWFCKDCWNADIEQLRALVEGS
jgi:hypothetical protein